MTTTRTSTTSRRAILTTAAAGAAGALALTACGSEDEDAGSAQDPGSNGSGDGATEDSGDGGGSDAPPSGEPLAALGDVPVGEATAVTTPDGEEAFVFRPDESTVAAFSAICTHQGCSVQSEGAELVCPCHNSVFDAATGEVLDGPAEEPLPAIAVRIEGDEIVTD